MLPKRCQNMRYFKRVRRSISQVSQGLNPKGLNHRLDLENLKHEKHCFITKMQRHFQNTKNTLLKIPIYKKAFFIQCRKQGKIFERNRLETQ